jgi:O-acetyl-ADP-ribose deacetylase (regulator of RNase III)
MRTFSLHKAELMILQGDITSLAVDAIVNAANERMLGGGGVDGAIHRAAGPELLEACKAVPEVRPGVRCPTGEARITPGFRLEAKHVIHTVGPVYRGADHSAPLLRSAYKSSLHLAREHDLGSIAFPAISCGVYGYPLDEAADVALTTIIEHAGELDSVRMALFDDAAFDAFVTAAMQLLDEPTS